MIESKQPARRNGVSINDNKLKGLNFDLEETLEAYKEIEDMKLRLLLDNHNGNNNLDFGLDSVFS